VSIDESHRIESCLRGERGIWAAAAGGHEGDELDEVMEESRGGPDAEHVDD